MPGKPLLSVALVLAILVGPMAAAAVKEAKTGKKPTTAPSDKIAERLKTIDPFYKQHIVSDGVLIVSSQKVSIYALREAAHLMRKMLANRPDVMKKVAARRIYICVMACSEMTTDMPETKTMSPWWDMRARGLGGNPLMCAEENLLCFKGDPWGGENIFVHEFAHIIHGAIEQLDGRSHESFEELFEKTKKTNRFRGYGMNNSGEFWAEGVQAWFDCNGTKRGKFAGGQSSLEALGPDGKHLCHIQTRKQLKKYLPELAKLLDNSFRQNKWVYTPPAKRLDQPHLRGYDPTKAPVFSWPEKVVENFIRLDAEMKAAKAKQLERQNKRIEGPIDPFLGPPRMEVQQLFNRERHPNVVVTLRGTVLATLGNTSLRARRSTDGGKTWGPEIIIGKPAWQGGGMTVDEVNGNIFAFAEDRHPPAPLSVYKSSDDGKTWRKVEVKIHPDTNGNVPSMHMNEHGITLRRGKHAGRLIRAARHYGKANYPRKHWPTHYTTAIYSDDRGKTWKTSKPFAEMGTGEAAIAELSDGTLYYNSRSHWNAKKPPMRRRCAWSRDGGETWTGWKIVQILPDGPQDKSYGCFGGLVRLPVRGRDILLFSNCDSPAHRNHGTVWVSFDGGKTWPLKRLVRKGSFEYSSLAAGRPGTPSEGWIYMHFEGLVPKDSHVARFNLSWLMAGKPTGDGVIPKIEK